MHKIHEIILWLKSLFRKPSPSVDLIQGETALLNVGLDFGTSSTKVVVRDLIKSKSVVAFLDNPIAKLPPFAVPSTVTITDGKLHFGRQAELMNRGRKLHSLKICLACQMALVECRGCEPQKETLGLRDGLFHIRSLENGSSTVSSETLVVAYIAYVMHLVYSWIDKHFTAREKSITFNISVPLDHIDVTEKEKEYNYYFYLAEKLSKKVTQEIRIQDWVDDYTKAKKQFPNLPDAANRNVFVQPETVAAVMPYTRAATAKYGLYAIVDIGAGTTDVSFFRLGSHLPRQMSFYFAKTHSVGGDNIDRDILRWLLTKISDDQSAETDTGRLKLLESVRDAKHQLSAEDWVNLTMNGQDIGFSQNDLQEICSGSFQKISETYEQAWMGAFKKEQRMNRWKDYNIVFLGGGSRLGRVRQLFKQPPRDFIEVVQPVEILPRDEIQMRDGELVKENLDFLCIAYGLSYPQIEFMNIRFPKQVPPLEPQPPPLELPDRDELYPP